MTKINIINDNNNFIVEKKKEIETSATIFGTTFNIEKLDFRVDSRYLPEIFLQGFIELQPYTDENRMALAAQLYGLLQGKVKITIEKVKQNENS